MHEPRAKEFTAATDQIRAANDLAFESIGKAMTDSNYTLKAVTIERTGQPPAVRNF